jgi:hypothetical protein
VNVICVERRIRSRIFLIHRPSQSLSMAMRELRALTEDGAMVKRHQEGIQAIPESQSTGVQPWHTPK